MKVSAKTIRDLEIYISEIIKDAPSIIAVYVFGSYAKKKEKEQSDIDLAFLLDEKEYKADPFEATGPAYMAAMRIGIKFKRETDVVILHSSSVELAYEAVTRGNCVHEAEQDRRLEYEAIVKGMYYAAHSLWNYVQSFWNGCKQKSGYEINREKDEDCGRASGEAQTAFPKNPISL
ncbi:MAG: nucleotidyltransferase domain-containing protein [Deltaproteobacteria bacterium]|nr:nucleotidyltransferase domain-containing protein [Deltaproteobacteria bacterium]